MSGQIPEPNSAPPDDAKESFWSKFGRTEASRVTRLLFALLLVSFAGKVAFRLLVTSGADYWQTGYTVYYEMAQNILHHAACCIGDPGQPDAMYAFRPPLYPLIIDAMCGLSLVSASLFVIFVALVSTLCVALVYCITARMASLRAALLSACFYAGYPYAFVHDTQPQENVLLNVLSLGMVASLLLGFDTTKLKYFFVAGILTGAAVLTRISHSAVGLVLFCVVLWTLRRGHAQAWKASLAFVMGGLLVVGPWLVRNEVLLGRFVLTSESGFALARAHNEYTFRYYPYRASIDESWTAYHEEMSREKQEQLSMLSGDELALGRWYSAEAISYMRGHLAESCWHGFLKAGVNFFGVLSPLDGLLKNLTYTVSYWLLTAPALYGLFLLRKTAYFRLFMAILLAQLAVSFVFWAHTSHRAHLDPLFAIPAGVGLSAWIEKRRSHIGRHSA